MAVDQDAVAPVSPGEVHLHDPVPRPAVQFAVKVSSAVDRIRIKVGHIAEPAAAGSPQDLGQERRLVHLATGYPHGRSDVLENQRDLNRAADSFDVAHDGIEGFMGAWKGGEVSDRYAAGSGEGQMLAPPGRRNPLNQSRKLV